jgi:hypothetical protein
MSAPAVSPRQGLWLMAIRSFVSIFSIASTVPKNHIFQMIAQMIAESASGA